jgi:light-independent protochlorophyllide reductase subunit B
MMGLEEHLIGMFRHDFEFVDGHRSHLGDGAPTAASGGEFEAATATATVPTPAAAPAPGTTTAAAAVREALESLWTADGEAELAKIPFFVRGKVRKNTEAFARERGLARIDAEALYDAKAHFSR